MPEQPKKDRLTREKEKLLKLKTDQIKLTTRLKDVRIVIKRQETDWKVIDDKERSLSKKKETELDLKSKKYDIAISNAKDKIKEIEKRIKKKHQNDILVAEKRTLEVGNKYGILLRKINRMGKYTSDKGLHKIIVLAKDYSENPAIKFKYTNLSSKDKKIIIERFIPLQKKKDNFASIEKRSKWQEAQYKKVKNTFIILEKENKRLHNSFLSMTHFFDSYTNLKTHLMLTNKQRESMIQLGKMLKQYKRIGNKEKAIRKKSIRPMINNSKRIKNLKDNIKELQDERYKSRSEIISKYSKQSQILRNKGNEIRRKISSEKDEVSNILRKKATIDKETIKTDSIIKALEEHKRKEKKKYSR